MKTVLLLLLLPIAIKALDCLVGLQLSLDTNLAVQSNCSRCITAQVTLRPYPQEVATLHNCGQDPTCPAKDAFAMGNPFVDTVDRVFCCGNRDICNSRWVLCDMLGERGYRTGGQEDRIPSDTISCIAGEDSPARTTVEVSPPGCKKCLAEVTKSVDGTSVTRFFCDDGDSECPRTVLYLADGSEAPEIRCCNDSDNCNLRWFTCSVAKSGPKESLTVWRLSELGEQQEKDMWQYREKKKDQAMREHLLERMKAWEFYGAYRIRLLLEILNITGFVLCLVFIGGMLSHCLRRRYSNNIFSDKRALLLPDGQNAAVYL